MIVATPAQLPVPGIPDSRMLEKYRRKGVAGLGASPLDEYGYLMTGSDPLYEGRYKNWVAGGDWSGGGGGSGAGSQILDFSLRTAGNILTNVLTPPAYQTIGPGGTTTIRYPAGSTGGGPVNNPLVGAPMDTGMLMLLLGAATLMVMVMNRR